MFGPKVLGLQSVLGALDVSVLSHVALFSSASAAFGNVGQADYAMANTCLNQIANLLASQVPGLRAKAFNWGPWDGGMVDAGLAELFAAQGIGLIDRPGRRADICRPAVWTAIRRGSSFWLVIGGPFRDDV